MQDAGYRIQDAGCKMHDAGCIPRVRVSGTGYLSSKHASTGFPSLPHYSVPSSLRSCRTASFPSNSAAPAGKAGRVKGEALSPRPVILLNYPTLNTWVLRL
jgi:hypothetical protein